MPGHSDNRRLVPLTIAALGVVYGDIGTSPLYALRETFTEEHHIPVDRGAVLGVLSLICWSLIIVISIKYVSIVLRADNHGEGGILALTALIAPNDEQRQKRNLLVGLGLFGTALLYGDGAITPAISVLSAVEGLKLAAPGLSPFVIPISIAILVGLSRCKERAPMWWAGFLAR
jgi:KUP system potassium uptake protein